MGQPKRPEVTEDRLAGFKYFPKVLRLLDRLHDAACGRDRAHNRQLHFDQYTTLLLFYFFNPIVTSLRGIQQAGGLRKVQRKLGVPRASLGSLAEAARVFDAELLRGLIGELAEELRPIRHDAGLADVRGVLTLVDATTLGALPRLTRAMWDQSAGKGIKLHTHFELLKGVPVRIDVTDGGDNERQQLMKTLLPDRVYVMDRGYASFSLFDAIADAGSSFVCRLRDNSVYHVLRDRPLTAADRDADVLSDREVSMDGDRRTLRLVQVGCTPHRKPYKIGRGGPEQGDTLLIATDLMGEQITADVVALIYRERWGIEIFFRFFKHVLGRRHLLSHSVNGVAIQTYSAVIACLLIALWTGRKPTLRTYEMICFYFTGLASEQELLAHIDRLPPPVETVP